MRNKPRLVAPFYDKYVCIWFYLVLRTVTQWLSVRLQHVHTNIYALIRELLGPRPLCRVPDIYSKPPGIWDQKAEVISFEIRTTNEIMEPRKDRNSAPFRFTKS